MMRVAVVGAGAVGGTASHLLSTGGCEVTLFEAREERRKELLLRGVRLRGALEGESRPKVLAPGTFETPFDAVILAVGAHLTAEALRPLSPLVHRDTFYLSLQEGSAVDELVGLVGADRAFAALQWLSAAPGGEGEIEVEEVRFLVLGQGLGAQGLGGKGGAVNGFYRLVSILEDVLPGRVRRTEDLRLEVWRRLASVTGMSLFCALTGRTPRELRSVAEAAHWLREAEEECRKVAASRGIDLPASDSLFGEAVWDRLPPPMLRDVVSGRSTERPFLSGYVLREAEEAGIRAPLLRALHSLVAEAERGERRPGEDNLGELRRRVDEERGMSLM